MKLQRVTTPYLPGQLCSVKGCTALAAVAVALLDRDASGKTVARQDPSCPFLCHPHQRENDVGRIGTGPERRADDRFPYTNQHRLPGWVSYLPLSTAEPIRGRR
jgi:hypothetical protein